LAALLLICFYQAGKPRSVDLYPIFNTGVPNQRPYQLATGKWESAGRRKPFINNFCLLAAICAPEHGRTGYTQETALILIFGLVWRLC
jgi:hypothetical protein